MRTAASLSVAVGLVAIALSALPDRLDAQIERADSAYAAEDRALAERLYAQVLTEDPWNSRATYRLATLHRDRPGEALRLFRRYTELEPDDPWGFLAVADQLTRMGRAADALVDLERARALAPGEVDVLRARARTLAAAGRVDEAVAAYGEWLASVPNLPEALDGRAIQLRRAGRLGEAIDDLTQAQEEEAQGARARRVRWWKGERAFALTPALAVSRDSDRNVVTRWEAQGDAPLGSRGRWGIALAHTRVWDGVTQASTLEPALRVAWRPKAAMRVEAWGGFAALSDTAGGGRLLPAGDARFRWRTPGGHGGVEVRGRRLLLPASPALVAAEAVRTEASVRADVPLGGPWAVRAVARRGEVTTTLGDNGRTLLQGGPVVHVLPAGEVSLQFLDLRYANATEAPYFAPRIAQVAEVGTYVELEGDGPWMFIVDGGVGLQRVARQGEALTGWKPSARLEASATWTPRGGSWLLLGVEAYDSHLEQLTGTTAAWRFLGIRVAGRLAIR